VDELALGLLAYLDRLVEGPEHPTAPFGRPLLELFVAGEGRTIAGTAVTGEFRRVILLGPPGSGKSALAAMRARETARTALTTLVNAAGRLGAVALPMAATLGGAARRAAVGEALEEVHVRHNLRACLQGQRVAEPVAEYLAQHCHEERAQLFLETSPDGNAAADAQALLQATASWECRLVILMSEAEHPGLLPAMRPIEVRHLPPFSLGQARDLVGRWFGPADDLGHRLADIPSLRRIWENPFLLTVLCATWQAAGPLDLGQLTPLRLLDQSLRLRPDASAALADFLEARRLAAALAGSDEAAARHAENLVDRRAWLPRSEPVALLLASQLEGPPLERFLSRLADPGRDDVLRHRLALAARCLAEVPPAVLAAHRAATDRLALALMREWWSHACNETTDAVPHLAAGLRALAQVPCRIGAQTLPDWLLLRIAQTQQGRQRRALRQTAQEWAAWLGTPEFLTGLAAIVGGVEAVQVGDDPVTGWRAPGGQPLPQDGPNEPGQDAAQALVAEVVELLGERAAQPAFLDILDRLLQGRSRQRRRALAVLAVLQPRAVVLERFAPRLIDLASYPVQDIQVAAIATAWGLGLATPTFVDAVIAYAQFNNIQQPLPPLPGPGQALAQALTARLGAAEPEARPGLLDAVRRLAESGIAPAVIPAVAALLEDPAAAVRARTASVLNRLWSAAGGDVPEQWRWPALLQRSSARARAALVYRLPARLAVIEPYPNSPRPPHPPGARCDLPHLLGDRSPAVRCCALRLVRRLHRPSPRTLARLAHRLADPRRMVRRQAVWTARALEAVIASPDFLRPLAGLLGRKHRTAWESFRWLGRVVRAPAAEEALRQLLAAAPATARRRAAAAELGCGAAPDALFTALAERLPGEESSCRARVGWPAELLVGEEVPAWFPGRLAASLGSAQQSERQAALTVIRTLRPAVATEELLTEVAHLLEDEDLSVSNTALDAVRCLGSAAAAPALLDLASALLDRPDPAAVWRATQILLAARMAGRPEFLRRLIDRLRQTDPTFTLRHCVGAALRALPARAIPPAAPRQLLDMSEEADDAVRLAVIGPLGVLAEISEGEYLDRLAGMLMDLSGAVRSAARDELARLGPELADPAMRGHMAVLLAAPDARVRRFALEALTRTPDPQAWSAAAPLWPGLLRDPSDSVRVTAIRAVAGREDPGPWRNLEGLLPALVAEKDPEVKAAALEAVARLGHRAPPAGTVMAVVREVANTDWQVGHLWDRLLAALRALAGYDVAPLALELRELLRHPQNEVRAQAAEAVPGVAVPRLTEALQMPLRRALGDPEAAVRRAAAAALMDHPPPEARADRLWPVARLVGDADREVRELARRAATALQGLPPAADFLPALARALRSADAGAFEAAADAFGLLGERAAVPEVLAALGAAARNPQRRLRVGRLLKALGYRLPTTSARPVLLEELGSGPDA
jgi:HEAT repeat protein